MGTEAERIIDEKNLNLKPSFIKSFLIAALIRDRPLEKLAEHAGREMIKTIIATAIGVLLAAAIIAGSVKGYYYIQCRNATDEQTRAYKWYQEDKDKADNWAGTHWLATYEKQKQACGE